MKILTVWLRDLLPGLTVDDHRLAEDLTLRGIAVEGIHGLGVGNGSLFEMDITTNRVDAMNHYGVAREAAAIYGLVLPPESVALPAGQPVQVPFPVSIEAREACGRFTACVLRDVTITSGHVDGPVSSFSERMFALLEQKRISNAVDATNFAWLRMGQPTHAFDLDKIEGGILVRRARVGEKLKTLDGIERTLDADDLIVADHVKPLGLAGVMGGWETMITPSTRNVLVEAAWFEPNAVRRTARRHGLHTDASHRFERGADWNAAPLASAIVCSMILESGGFVEGDLVDVVVAAIQEKTANRTPVKLALREVDRLLGTTLDSAGISGDTVHTVLKALGCELTSEAEDRWEVTLPSWRLDLAREIDLIEEVARVYGYNRFANTLPAFAGGIRALPNAQAESLVRSTLLASGIHEAISSTFTSAEEAALTAAQPGLVVPLGNPLSEEAGVLRPSLVPGMLSMIAGNLHRDVGDVRLFELGTVFSGATEKVDERPSLAIGLVGGSPETGPHQPSLALDFYDLKGLVEQLLTRFRMKSVYFDSLQPVPGGMPLVPAWLHPYRAARLVVDGMTMGWLGQLHPQVASRRKLKEAVLVAEIYLDRLLQLPLQKPAVREISRFQPVRRDFSLMVRSAVSWSSLDEVLAGVASLTPELVDWRVREIFRDPQPSGSSQAGDYSLLLGTTFQAGDRTLREEELQEFSQRIVEAVSTAGARLRS